VPLTQSPGDGLDLWQLGHWRHYTGRA
jgi:hypothetical protein